MKKILTYLSVIFVMFIVSNCSESLIDLQPKNQLTIEKALSTLDGLEGSILAVYERGRFPYESNDICLYKLCVTDLVQCGTNLTDQAIFNAIARLATFDATNAGVRDIWNGYYIGLSRCNIIISNIDNVSYNKDNPVAVKRKNTVKGEAYYFRAYFHINLVQRWDNIILADHVFDNPEEPAVLAEKSKVYDLIVTDLKSAIELLPEASDVDNRGRATKGVARHLLSKAYMDLGNWAEAADMATQVANDPAFVLQKDNLDQIFSVKHQDNKEIIFAWQFGKGDAAHPQRCSQQMAPLYDRINGVARTFAQGGRPWSRIVPSPYYWTLFEPNDKRLDAWHKRYWVYDVDKADDALPPGVKIGDTVTAANLTDVNGYGIKNIYPTSTKLWEDETLGRTIDQAEGYRNIIQYRVAEAYIIAAEAYMRAGNIAAGLPYINALRNRAGVSEFTTLTEQIILDEHARELGHEGVRWEMLKRLGILISSVQAHSPEVGNNILPKHVRWPIPKVFVDLTKVKQNEGYE